MKGARGKSFQTEGTARHQEMLLILQQGAAEVRVRKGVAGDEVSEEVGCGGVHVGGLQRRIHWGRRLTRRLICSYSSYRRNIIFLKRRIEFYHFITNP